LHRRKWRGDLPINLLRKMIPSLCRIVALIRHIESVDRLQQLPDPQPTVTALARKPGSAPHPVLGLRLRQARKYRKSLWQTVLVIAENFVGSTPVEQLNRSGAMNARESIHIDIKEFGRIGAAFASE
jgi:hypothetical protein